LTSKDIRETVYVKLIAELRSCNHCSSGEAKRIT